MYLTVSVEVGCAVVPPVRSLFSQTASGSSTWRRAASTASWFLAALAAYTARRRIRRLLDQPRLVMSSIQIKGFPPVTATVVPEV